MNFIQAQAYLNSLQMHKIKLGLDSMESFLEKVGQPHRELQYVHVAGTNGKGSVSVSIVSMLGQAGYRVGLFTSPHLSSVRERFRINGDYISEETFARLASRVRQVLGDDMITYFEFTTAIALLWFVSEEVDLVVLETGLGGRLDATNIVTPLAGVITNVSMDHEAYLGDSLESIAFEKAGIIKPGIPLVTAATDEVPTQVIGDRCAELDAPVLLLGEDFSHNSDQSGGFSWHGSNELFGVDVIEGLSCYMRGDYQRDNASLAVAVVCLLRQRGFSITDRQIRQGLLAVRWPGRLEYIKLDRETRRSLESLEQHDGAAGMLRYLIDGAHNPAGVESLVNTLRHEYDYGRLIVVWGAMEDKDLGQTLPKIAQMAHALILTRPEGERAASPEKLVTVVAESLRQKCILQADVSRALSQAEALASESDLILIAGSLYLIGEVRKMLLGELVEQ